MPSQQINRQRRATNPQLMPQIIDFGDSQLNTKRRARKRYKTFRERQKKEEHQIK